MLPSAIWRELLHWRQHAALDAPVFPSGRGGGHLHVSSIERIVAKAAARAGLELAVSPHWLRHSHATHALERGSPIDLVAATLGHASVATTGK
jgi:integrase/recombinase XerD